MLSNRAFMDLEFAAQHAVDIWGRHAAVKWIMKQNGWNYKTALRCICIAKQLSVEAQ